MAVSGMANTVFSVTTRKVEWTDTPTPPPITVACHSATVGFTSASRATA